MSADLAQDLAHISATMRIPLCQLGKIKMRHFAIICGSDFRDHFAYLLYEGVVQLPSSRNYQNPCCSAVVKSLRGCHSTVRSSRYVMKSSLEALRLLVRAS